MVSALRGWLWLLLVAALALGAWRGGQALYAAGAASVELANAQALADANAAALQAWRAATAEQAADDAARRAQDLAADARTAEALRSIDARLAALARQPPPPGRCDLTPEWVRRFNEAR